MPATTTNDLARAPELALLDAVRNLLDHALALLVARHPDIVWDTAERIMVVVPAAPGTDAVLRRAARIALRAHADLQAVYVVGDDGSRPVPKQALEAIKHLSDDLGATWHDIVSDDPAPALVHFAKENQITQIVLGAPRRSRWGQLTSRSSVVQRVLRFARQSGVDVHVINRYGESAPLGTAPAPEDGGG